MTSHLRAAQRREKRGRRRSDALVKHGVCSQCSRRRVLVLPSKLCEGCCRAADA